MSTTTSGADSTGQGLRVELGTRVAIEYSVYLESGAQVDSNAGGEPLELVCGMSQVMPAHVELTLVGLHPGEGRRITLEPERAYGPRVADAVREVDAAFIPAEARRVGAALVAEGGDGQRRVSRVVEVRGDRVVVDHNHPLAGLTLTFEVKVLAIIGR